MRNPPRLLILVAATLLLASGCSDSRPATPTDDQGRADQAPPRDAAPLDQRAPDAAKPDAATLDLSPADAPARPDGNKLDVTPRDQAVSKPDGGGTVCSADTDCKVFEDCCDCTAVFAWVSRPICKKMCFVTTCTALGFTKPTAYCAGGRCLLTEGGGASCVTDSDCQKVDNCCDCLALPTSVTAPTCNMGPCFVTTCVGQGLSNAAVKCLSGTCKLVP